MSNGRKASGRLQSDRCMMTKTHEQAAVTRGFYYFFYGRSTTRNQESSDVGRRQTDCSRGGGRGKKEQLDHGDCRDGRRRPLDLPGADGRNPDRERGGRARKGDNGRALQTPDEVSGRQCRQWTAGDPKASRRDSD